MRITIDFSEEEEEKLLRDIFSSYPEASGGNSLRCCGYNYKKFKFSFCDLETGKDYDINLEKAREVFHKFVAIQTAGKGLHQIYAPKNLFDAGDYDAISTDAIVQCAIFGKIIYR